jgi:hypothetical protein
MAGAADGAAAIPHRTAAPGKAGLRLREDGTHAAVAWAPGKEQAPTTSGAPARAVPENQLPAAVVGSIMRLTSVTLLAGKPLISACFLITASSLAR